MIDLEGLDLNLLLALDALLIERNVTRAGKRVGLAQSSMSYSLARLREIFEDPLFIRTAGGMVPTARAEALQEPLHRAIEGLRSAIRPAAGFNPANCDSSFRVAVSTAQQLTHFPSVLRTLARVAPAVSIQALPPSNPSEAFQKLRMGELDFVVGQFDELPDAVHCATLLTDRVVYVVRKDHPRIKRRLSLAQIKREKHIQAVPATAQRFHPQVRQIFDAGGVSQQNVLASHDALVCLLIVSRTDLLYPTLATLAKPFSKALGLRILEPPLEIPRVEVHLAWHNRTHRSSSHRWFRELLLGVEVGS